MKTLIALFIASIIACADTVTYTSDILEFGGNFTDTLVAPKFDGSLGTLTHVSATVFCNTHYRFVGHHGPVTVQEHVSLYLVDHFIGGGAYNVSLSNHQRVGMGFVGQTLDDETSDSSLMEEFAGSGNVEFTVEETLFNLDTTDLPPSWVHDCSHITLTVTYTYTH